MQIALGVTAHQFLVFGEGHITLDDACTHAGCGFVGFFGVFRKLHRRSAMADGKIAALERAVGAAFQFGFEPARVHVIDQKIRARAHLDGIG